MDNLDVDPLFDEASVFVTEKQVASITAIQRRFRIGYNRAARIVEQLESRGIVSVQDMNGNRNVLTCHPDSFPPVDSVHCAKHDINELKKKIDEINSVEYLSRLEAITNKRIVIWLDQKTAGSEGNSPVFILRSYSPFEDLAAKQKVDQDIATEPMGYYITGYKFTATMQMRTPAKILHQHGRIERVASWKLPKIISEPWQGIWTSVTKTWREMGIDIDEMPMGTMASDIGQVSSDGGDYLRFLLFIKHLNSLDISYLDKKDWINTCYHMVGEDGEPFCKFMDAYGANVEQIASRLLD